MRKIVHATSRQLRSTRFSDGWGILLSSFIEAQAKLHLFVGIVLMRSGGMILACSAFLPLLSGCQTQDNLYLRQGAGIDLFSSSLPEATRLQDAYVTYICDQAGLGPSVPGPLGCDASAFGPAQWTIFVQSGMNDIDQRCDSYLAWLDDKKRWATPALQQISDFRTATEAIMVATGASGPYPIGIVGAAFGLATRTFTNINSRLVLELNHSTVQSIVLNRQKQYRIKLLGDLGQRPPLPPILIETRPAAIHALRSYLRLCMPFTIETEINTTITDIERTGVLPAPLITPETVRSAVIVDVNQPLPTDPGIRFGPNSGSARSGPDVFRAQVDKALCTVQTGQSSDAAVRDFFVGQGLVADNAPLPITNIKNRDVNQMLKNVVASVGDCAKKGLRNAYEIGLFGVTSDNQQPQVTESISDFQSKLQEKLNKLGAKFSDFKKGVLDKKTRQAIIDFRAASTLDVTLGDQIDRKLYTAVTSTNPPAAGAASGTGTTPGAGNGSGAGAIPGTAVVPGRADTVPAPGNGSAAGSGSSSGPSAGR
ncbi:hypothetical protein AOQ72_24750 [Bradyrhizobium yuanmingense]|uniref:Peptidoglycan binding domain-containing protein n=1 Tax=Bradyrhizobium yuanmingense TaxID=108015 RepID=A0A0R3CA66_9BRAD|nr:hypothetical protein [Bradyrhizobium yuanmingense]KRP94399.1 hypothetical protein AOQ72_24750 [Bradyrhizobium yuanmingense]